MTQPIDRETIRQFAEASGIRCFDEQIVAKLQNVAMLAVAHSRKDAEPVAWQLRIGDSPDWSFCRDESDADFYGKKSGMKYVKEPLFAHPPEADKLLQQAIAALDSCGAYPNGITWVNVNKTTNAAHAIRTYLEGKNAKARNDPCRC